MLQSVHILTYIYNSIIVKHLFSAWLYFGELKTLLFSRLKISCTKILLPEILTRTSFLRPYGLTNIRENKVLENIKCFKVYFLREPC